MGKVDFGQVNDWSKFKKGNEDERLTMAHLKVLTAKGKKEQIGQL